MTNLLTQWGISLAEYEQGNWGASAGYEFKPQTSAMKRFKIEVDNSSDEWFDDEACFKEIATNVISIIKANKRILNKINPSTTVLDDSTTKILQENTIEDLKKAVYAGIQHMNENQEAWEMTLQNSIATKDFTIGSSPTTWIHFASMLGKIAWIHLQNSDIDNYEINEDTGEVIYRGVNLVKIFKLYPKELDLLLTKHFNQEKLVLHDSFWNELKNDLTGVDGITVDEDPKNKEIQLHFDFSKNPDLKKKLQELKDKIPKEAIKNQVHLSLIDKEIDNLKNSLNDKNDKTTFQNHVTDFETYKNQKLTNLKFDTNTILGTILQFGSTPGNKLTDNSITRTQLSQSVIDALDKNVTFTGGIVANNTVFNKNVEIKGTLNLANVDLSNRRNSLKVLNIDQTLLVIQAALKTKLLTENLNMFKKGIYMDIGASWPGQPGSGQASNLELKKSFDSISPRDNNEYLVLRDIIQHAKLVTINGIEQFALIEGNWLVDHLKKGQNLGSDFTRYAGTKIISFSTNDLITYNIYFYKSDNDYALITYNEVSDNFLQLRYTLLSNEQKNNLINWVNEGKVLNYDTPIFIDGVFKKLNEAFINKGNVKGEIKTSVPFFTVLFKKDTNEFANSSNISDNLEVIANNTEYMEDNPVEVTQRNSNTIRVKFNFKKALPNGIFKLRLLLNKNKETWVNMNLVNSNLFSNYLYESTSNYSSASRNGSWRDRNPTAYPTNKEFMRSSGQQAEVNIIFGNNGILWTYRTGTGSRASSWTSYGTHQIFHTGEIRSNDKNKPISGEPIIFDISATGIILKKSTMIFLTEEIGL